MDLLVVYESELGRGRDAADAIAKAAAAHGVATLIRSIDEFEPFHLEPADALVAGCWTQGKVPFGDAPTRNLAAWIEELPDLGGMPVGVFCTYRFFPHTFADMATRTAETEAELANRFESKGGEVVARVSINTGSIEEGADKLVESVLQEAHAG
ncbi:MAG: hypothetical protein GY720_11260 [bacterium]|nr:hypothetical protein [bacterium]